MEKQIPHNIEAEKGVLGSIIIDPEIITSIAALLTVDDFYRAAHKRIYETILELYARREPADSITLSEALEHKNALEEIGGFVYLHTLPEAVPTSANAEHYARIVAKMAQFRRLIQAAGEIAASAYKQDEDAIDKAEEMLHNIRQNKRIERVISLQDAVSQYMTKLDTIHENKKRGLVTGIPTGFKSIDQVLGGLQPSDLIILAARPAMGKTSLALDMARHIISESYGGGRKVLVFSLEMGQEQLVRRLISMQANIDQTQLRTGDIHDEEWERVVDAASTLSQGKMWIDDTPAINVMEMHSRARRIQAQYGLDMIIVDYMQLMNGASGGKHKQENRVQEVSAISRGLKELARDLNVPVIALAQLSRAIEQRSDKTPQLSDLRESGTIEQDADIVKFIYKPEDQEIQNPEQPGYMVHVVIAKHRNGPTGVAPLWFTPNHTRFSDIDFMGGDHDQY